MFNSSSLNKLQKPVYILFAWIIPYALLFATIYHNVYYSDTHNFSISIAMEQDSNRLSGLVIKVTDEPFPESHNLTVHGLSYLALDGLVPLNGKMYNVTLSDGSYFIPGYIDEIPSTHPWDVNLSVHVPNNDFQANHTLLEKVSRMEVDTFINYKHGEDIPAGLSIQRETKHRLLENYNMLRESKPTFYVDFRSSIPKGIVNKGLPATVINQAFMHYTSQGSNFSEFTDDGTHPLSLDFSKDTPDFFNTKPLLREGGAYFNGQFRLYYPNTEASFETDPMAVYIEYKPLDKVNRYQQIIGHFNWEIWQYPDRVQLRVGRMDNEFGPVHVLDISHDESFFDEKHQLLFIYAPGDDGFIELMIDNTSVKKGIGSQRLYRDYGDFPLSIGLSKHGSTNYFKGFIYKLKIVKNPIIHSEVIPQDANNGIDFDGHFSLELENSKHLFENESFLLSVNFTVDNIYASSQQIIGHFNWELLIHEGRIIFQTGRHNNHTGPMHSVSLELNSSSKEYHALAEYRPGDNGAISLAIGNSATSSSIGTDKISLDYGNYDLSFGKSKHGGSNHFEGSIRNVEYYSNIDSLSSSDFRFDGTQYLQLVDSEDKFEDSFVVNANYSVGSQERYMQIAGHYNWELYHDNQSVVFKIGRLDNSSGRFELITRKIDAIQLNETINVVAIYYQNEETGSQMLLSVNNESPSIKNLGNSSIYRDYGNFDLTLGKGFHESTAYFNGIIHQIELAALEKPTNEFHYEPTLDQGKNLSLVFENLEKVKTIELTVEPDTCTSKNTVFFSSELFRLQFIQGNVVLATTSGPNQEIKSKSPCKNQTIMLDINSASNGYLSLYIDGSLIDIVRPEYTQEELVGSMWFDSSFVRKIKLSNLSVLHQISHQQEILLPNSRLYLYSANSSLAKLQQGVSVS